VFEEQRMVSFFETQAASLHCLILEEPILIAANWRSREGVRRGLGEPGEISLYNRQTIRVSGVWVFLLLVDAWR